MFERFTDRARRVVVLAQEQARELRQPHIDTEHILLGVLIEGEGIAVRALESFEISPSALRARIEAGSTPGPPAPTSHIPFRPGAKKALELSLREALGLKHNYIGTEHLLLGLLREGEGVAARMLTESGADLEQLRSRVVQIATTAAADAPFPPAGPHVTLAVWAANPPADGRGDVFVAYSPADRVWLDRLAVHLRPVVYRAGATAWDETPRAQQPEWQAEAIAALARSKAAILLVTADLIGSDLVQSGTLPALLGPAADAGCAVLPLLARPSLFDEVPGFARFEPVNPPNRPLSATSPHEQEELLVQLARRIIDLPTT